MNPLSTASSGAQVPAVSRHRALLFIFVALLIWVPIPIGSNRPWSLAILEAVALFLLGAWSLGYAFRPFALPTSISVSRIALLILSAWALYPAAQLLSLPPALSEYLTGYSHELYSQLPIQSAARTIPVSVDRGATLAGLVRQVSLVAVFFCTLAFVTSRSRLKLVLFTLLTVGFFEALYGLMLLLGDGIGLWDPGHDAHAVSGTYVNQNHFGGLMEITIAVGTGFLLALNPGHGQLSSTKGYLRLVCSYVLDSRGLVLFMLLVMIAALVMTTSRGAAGSLAAGLSTAVIIAAFRKGFAIRETKIALATVVLATLALGWLGSGGLAAKLESEGLSSDRGDLREVSYRIVSESPLVGTGVGTYRWVFPAYKDARFGSGFYEHAHNDYLEVLGEQGFVGFGLLAAGGILVLWPIFRAYGTSNDPLVRGTLFAVVAGSVSLLVHGLVDFNFQIPANSVYFSVLLALGLVAAELQRSDHR